MFDIKPYKVYIKTDEKGRITAINSDAFLSSLDGWIEIDSGFGDRHHHAQGNYFDKPLFDNRGLFNYKYINNAVIERTEEEKNAEWVEPTPQPTAEERIKQLEEALTALLEGATE